MNNTFINRPLLRQAYNGPFKLIDKGLLEHIGPTGFGALVRRIGAALAGAQTGRAYDYAGMFLAMLYVTLLFAGSTLLNANFVETVLFSSVISEKISIPLSI